MDLANLNAFIAIAETGSFSGAGERLHLTQPAISKRIAGLEQQLKVRLFDRLGREVGLTEAGRALLPRAYQILNVLDDTRRALTNLSGEVTGRLTLATSHHIGLHRLPPLLREFTRRYPQVALDIQFLDSEVAYEEILHGRAELAVITLAPEPHTLVRATPVWDDPWISWSPRNTHCWKTVRSAWRTLPCIRRFSRGQHVYPSHRATAVRSPGPDAEHRHEHELPGNHKNDGLHRPGLERLAAHHARRTGGAHSFAGHTTQSPARLYLAHRTDAVERRTGFHGLTGRTNRFARDKGIGCAAPVGPEACA